MQVPMIGAWIVTIRGVRPFEIHGDRYFEIAIERDEEPGKIGILRVAEHAAGASLNVGERVVLTFLMGQVTQVKNA